MIYIPFDFIAANEVLTDDFLRLARHVSPFISQRNPEPDCLAHAACSGAAGNGLAGAVLGSLLIFFAISPPNTRVFSHGGRLS